MALISCPYCGEEISDRAQQCPHCNRELEPSVPRKYCTECGALLTDGETVCHSCGCPIDEAPVREDTSSLPEKKKYHWGKIAIILLVVLGVILAINYNAKKAQQEAEFYEITAEIENLLNNGIEDLNYTTALFRLVTYNVLFDVHSEETDAYACPSGQFLGFPEALDRLYEDAEFSFRLSELESDAQQLIRLRNRLQKLTFIPAEWQEYAEYELDLINVFLEGTRIMTNPTGTIFELTARINSMFEEWNRLMDEINALSVW